MYGMVAQKYTLFSLSHSAMTTRWFFVAENFATPIFLLGKCLIFMGEWVLFSLSVCWLKIPSTLPFTTKMSGKPDDRQILRE